jgi:Asp-tRNA(Asn)/Glu-tRNA(Gln) amidotransferase A subunit family amidase
MSLAWTMDKIGPIARSLEDCALVLDAIHGADGFDAAAVDHPFVWPPQNALESLKIGYIEIPNRPADEREELMVLRQLGFELVPITLPDDLPIDAITLMLGTEAAAVFDELTRKHITEGLNSWPETFRNGQFVPAVEYLRAARVRTKLMRAMDERMKTVDLYVSSGADLPITNLTGHPSIVFPMGFRERNGRTMPGSVTLTGRLYDESSLLAVGCAFQQATGDHLRRPPLERYLADQEQKSRMEKQKSKNDAG